MANRTPPEGYEYVTREPITVHSFAPQPAYPASPNPTSAAMLPSNMQLQPDQLRQFYNPVVSATRIAPPPAQANITANASAQSQATTVATSVTATALSGSKGSLQMPSNTFIVGGDVPLTATAKPVTVGYIQQQNGFFLCAPPIAGGGSSPILDAVGTDNGNSTSSLSVGPLTPASGTDWALYAISPGFNLTTGPTGLTQEALIDLNGQGYVYHGPVTGAYTATANYSSSQGGAAVLALFFAPTGIPSIVQVQKSPGDANLSLGSNTVTLNPTQKGNTLIFVGLYEQSGTVSATFGNVSDGVDNFQLIGTSSNMAGTASVWVYAANNIAAGTTSLTFDVGPGSSDYQVARFWVAEVTDIAPGVAFPEWRAIVNNDLQNAVFGASGTAHCAGAVPDPGATSGSARVLYENATWGGVAESVNSATGAITVAAGTGIGVATSSGTITVSNSGVTSMNSLTGALAVTGTGGINVTTSGADIVVDGTGIGGATFETNGTNNSSQSVLNLKSGTGITVTNTSGGDVEFDLTTPVSVAHGGTGTSSPALVAGTNVTITGTWPNQTIAASGGGGGGGGGATVKTTSYTAVSGDSGTLLAFNTSSGGSFSLVQTAAGGSTSCTFGTAPTVGNLIILECSSLTGTTPTPSGGPCSVYTQIQSTTNRGDGYFISLFYGIATSGGTTINVSGLSSFPGVNAYEFSGNASSSVLDVSSSVSGNHSTTIGSAVTTTVAGDLVFTQAFDAAGPGGFTTGGGGYTYTPSSGSSNNWIMYGQVGAPGSYEPTVTFPGASNTAIITAAFKPAAGASLTLTLPASPPSSTWNIWVNNVGIGSLTVDPNGLDLNGSPSNLNVAQNDGFYITTDGTNYFYI